MRADDLDGHGLDQEGHAAGKGARAVQSDESNSTGGTDLRAASADGLNGASRAGKVRVVVCALLLCAACAEFVARGVLRAPGNSGDFAVFYTGARAWTHGTNPYDVENLKRVARQAGDVPENSLHNSAYPPATFVILAPVSLLPWEAAKVVWAGINTVAILMLAYGVVRLADLRLTSPLGMLLAAGVLALAPIHTGVHVGQLTPVLAACIVLAYLLDDKRRVWLGGVLLAIATVLKPQVGMVFIGFEFIRSRFRVALLATLFTALIFVVAIGWLAVNHVDWWSSWYDNYHAFMHGGAGDPRPINPTRHQLLNLHYPLRSFLPPGPAIEVITLSFVGTLGVVGLIALRKLRGRRAELLGLSLFGVLSLLAVYQRYYSAILLVFPLAWAIVELRSRRRRALPIISLGLTAVFFVPTAMALNVAAGKGYIPAGVADSWWWQGIIMPHQVYALAAMATVLVIATWQARGRIGQPPRPAATDGN